MPFFYKHNKMYAAKDFVSDCFSACLTFPKCSQGQSVDKVNVGVYTKSNGEPKTGQNQSNATPALRAAHVES
jgi:hypothetical protein